MPRLTNYDYLNRRDLLSKLWLQSSSAYGVLSPTDQRALHDYFATTDEFTEDQLLHHRKNVTKIDPSLPNRAGKAFSQLIERLAINGEPQVEPARSGVTVRAIMNPKLDIPKLAQLLIRQVEDSALEGKEAA